MDKQQMWNEIREHYNLKRNVDVARYFGVKEQVANNWTKRGVMDLERVYQLCPDISPDWLLSRGESGPMVRPAHQSINGDNNTQVGGNYQHDCNSLSQALEMLAREKDENKKLQEQIVELLGIVKNLTTSSKE